MLSPPRFRELVSGRARGPSAVLWRGLFSAVEPFYTAVVRYRNWRIDTGRAAIERVEVPVVSVGNLTLGGTGKTPMVEWLARWFRERDLRVALVSRGYGSTDGQENDEARELREKLPDVPHLQNPQRVIAAREAIAQHDAQVILLDDGYQHRRLARDLDIVLVDALEPFGFEHVFPRGMLREPLSGFARAQVIALSRADAVEQPTRERIRERVRHYNPDALWLELAHAPRALRGADGRTASLEELRGQRVLAFCGIGNPAGFRHVLAECGYELADFREFPDHHAFSDADITAIAAQAQRVGAKSIVCTHKDLVKLGQSTRGDVPLWALEIGMRITAGQQAFEQLLEVLAAKARR